MEQKTSTTDRLFDAILARISDGTWPVGSAIPGERKLIEEFGVSRIALRETLAALRALGVIETAHGKRSRICPVDANVLAKLFPLMVHLDGEHTYKQVFDTRLAIEPESAALAAQHRSDEDVALLNKLCQCYEQHIDDGNQEAAVDVDLAFHEQVAKASSNPLLALLFKTLGSFTRFVARKSCEGSLPKHGGAAKTHRAICEAIAAGESAEARKLMRDHLLESA